MRKIAVVTGTRAEYGLLKNIMKEIENDINLSLILIVTGSHLSIRLGETVKDIVEDGFNITAKCPILLDYTGDDKNAREISLAINSYAIEFNRYKPDILLILGDRYETFAAAITAISMNIPIAHISGGEITEGAMDEQIRHSITKLAHIHFTATNEYCENIIRMGEEPWRVFNVGDPGIENIKLTNILSRSELKNYLGFNINENIILVTYHPVTLEYKYIKECIENLLSALERIGKDIIITYPNSDNGNEIIIEKIEEFKRKNNKVHVFKSLGSVRYLSVMKYCGAIVGNSSSAIVEGAFMKKPVVNIGSRQKGRLMSSNIISVSDNEEDIYNAINQALSKEFNLSCKNSKCLYGEGDTSKEIVNILKNIEIDDRLLKKKLCWKEN